jgi:Spy/CpxP family protein refolding chaperone
MDMHLKTTLLPMLTCSLTAMTLIWSPGVAWAQVKPAKSAFPLLSHLNLTAQQQVQMQQLRQSARIQLEEILSSEQMQQFANSMFRDSDLLAAVVAMQLSPNQQQRLLRVFQGSRQQMQVILTPEQQNQLRQQIQERVVERVP